MRCLSGTYCPAGSAGPIACDSGSYCMHNELALPNGLCSAGYFCNGSATRPDPPDGVCPSGSYCPAGTGTPVPCPGGTMSNSVGNTNLTNCDACTGGFFCAGTGNTMYTGPCGSMYFCPDGQQSATPPAYGCPVGHYCPGGTIGPVTCPAGMYQDQASMDTCKDCPSGKYVLQFHVL